MNSAFASATAAQETSYPQFPLVRNVVSIRTRRQMRRLPGIRETEADHALTFETRPADEERSESNVTAARVKINQIPDAVNSDQIVGNSPALRDVLQLTEKVASWDSTVLLLGETGTGKELVAQAIHRQSNRSHRPLIKVNCAALPSELVASELFGHEKGAFTGALQQRIGRFEAANGGTIFLDEIAELSPEIQVALLRVLQEKEFERVGGNRTIKTDVRVIAATNKDLQQEVSAGRFRMDLFYRLNVFPIRVPALRERLEDIPLLVDYFAGRLAGRMGKEITQIDRRSLSAMQQYSWPGNVRELQNVIERSVILADGEVLRVDPAVLLHDPSPCINAPAEVDSGSGGLDRKARIEAVLRETRGKVYGPNGAAARLQIAGTTLDSQILALGIKKYQFK
jgi:formate hydrogenlyase transcriptional activator